MPNEEEVKTSTEQAKTPASVKVRAEDDDDEKIPHPTLELYRHTLLRGANSGALLTLVFGAPVLLFRGVRQPAELMARLAKASVTGMVSSEMRTF